MTEEHDAALAALALRSATRVERGDPVDFVDRDFVHWRVTERDASADPGSHSRWCLIFTCPEAARRVWNYPPNWRTLTNTELVALSWSH